MAPTYSSDDSDDGLPDLDTLINKHVNNLHILQAPKLDPTTANRTFLKISPRKSLLASTSDEASKQQGNRRNGDMTTDSSPKKKARSRQGQQAKHKVTSRKSRISNTLFDDSESGADESVYLPAETHLRATPHRNAKSVPRPGAQIVSLDDTSDEDEASEVEESIWCDSDHDTALQPQITQKKAPSRSPVKHLQLRTITPDTDLSDSDDLEKSIFQSKPSPRKPIRTYRSPGKIERQDVTQTERPAIVPSFSDKENDAQAILRFSPPTKVHAKPRPAPSRPSTPPPASPSKARLISPSKKKPQVPTPPHRPSIDAFWNVHEVVGWHDHHSPQKPLASPRKNHFLTNADSDSPSASPRKSQSPSKRSRAAMEARKDFEDRKHKLCETFIEELDREITDGKIKALAAATGGIRFIWSKTLNTTAGRANWKREKSQVRELDGTTTVTYKHHASIELAEKVIDDEERLLNVLAHEFCHLANFMVSEIKDQPHGKQFKAWGAKCTKAFGHRGVEVTTKHSYAIDYKYIWACQTETCRHEFKRHSKSIDPARHTCGACRGKLAQIKPVPRKQAGATGYAAFVKEHFAAVKKEMAGASHKDVMAAVGKKYREQKASAEKESMDEIAKALEVVDLDRE